MSESLLTAVVAALVGLIFGGAGSALMVWQPMNKSLSALASDVQAVKTVLRGVVDWQEEFDKRTRDRLEEYERSTRFRRKDDE